ncbi:MAG: TetR/AcrR family transcriptional regulator [Pseudomonadota bacterium]
METTISRKQREILRRDQQILDAAGNILRREGFQALNMERIAQAIEYARGTVYQHYPNKEEIVAALCQRNMRVLTELLDRALQYAGQTRERMLAVMLAYELYWQLHPDDLDDFQILKSEAIRSKLSPGSQKSINETERYAINCIAALVREALKAGDLSLDNTSPEELVFGLWAMAFGAISLHSSDIPLTELGINNPMAVARSHAGKLLDGYNWKPTSDDWDYTGTANHILKTQFAPEMALLNSAKENIS